MSTETETESFFGGMDAELIGDNPFYLPEDTYLCVCIDAPIKKKEDGTRQLMITWSVADPESKQYNKRVSQYFTMLDWPANKAKAKEFWDGLDAKEQRSQQFLMATLTKGFGLSMAEVSKVNSSVLQGREAYVSVKDTQDKEDATKTYTNVKSVLSKELWEEKNGVTAQSHASDFGI